MNPKKLVNLSNNIGIASIILLIYWVFIFIAIMVFDLKIFRRNMTEIFFMSIFGIIALMAGALIINIMFNLTRIAEKHNQDKESGYVKTSKRTIVLFLLSFPIIFCLLFGGHYLSAKKKERVLTQTAISIVENSRNRMSEVIDYSFDKAWINNASSLLHILAKTDKNFPFITIITKDSSNKIDVFLEFSQRTRISQDTIPPNKQTYIFQTDQEERNYLNKVFLNQSKDLRYSADGGRYELFFPFRKGNKVVVLHFSDYQNYGKYGS
jgi:hypothetical protein